MEWLEIALLAREAGRNEAPALPQDWVGLVHEATLIHEAALVHKASLITRGWGAPATATGLSKRQKAPATAAGQDRVALVQEARLNMRGWGAPTAAGQGSLGKRGCLGPRSCLGATRPALTRKAVEHLPLPWDRVALAWEAMANLRNW